ncbi:MAG TPA: thioesterase family protein [Kofleriaceae bacterium]|nr:thioesterase family protein [Kofleriaceae bacterium]
MGELDLDRIVTPARTGDGRFAIEVPDGWQQGRGAFGGLVVAMLVRAIEATVGDAARPLRALNAEIVGPTVPGRAELAVEILRAGTGVTTASARLLQQGAVQAHATAALGKARTTHASPLAIPPPQMPPWRDVPVSPVVPPVAPVFTQHMEFRVTAGAPLSSRQPGGEEVAGWVRLHHPGRARDAALIAALIDSYWPALLVSATTMRSIATLAFALQTVAPLDGLDREAPLFYRARNLAGADGYAIETRELWGEDGRLVAINQQTIVVMA